MSSKDLVKKFHSLASSYPLDPISSSLPKADAMCDSNNNAKQPNQQFSTNCTSNFSKVKRRKKDKTKNRPKLEEDDNVVDSPSLSFFFKGESKKGCSGVASGFDSHVFIHGYGKIPVIKGDFQLMPQMAQEFVAEKAAIMQPRAIFICDGSLFELNVLTEDLERTHQFKRLIGSGSSVFLARSDLEDAKKIGKCLVVTTKRRLTTESKGGAKNKLTNWMSTYRLRLSLADRFPGCMRGRVMYIVPFSMGPIGSYRSMNGIQLTDSAYIVSHMHLITRVSTAVWDAMGNSDFIKCIHSIGLPRPLTNKLKQNWLCNVRKTFVGHWMERREIWSFGSNLVENALLPKECLALRMASAIGRDEGWLAEHMAIISITNPDGKEFFIGVASPSGVGKTALATMKPSLTGWKVQLLGDDVAWLKFDESDGQMYAMNPENGMHGLAIGVNKQHNPDLLKMLSKDTIFTNVAETSDGRAWWQGIGDELPEDVSITNWHGKDLAFLTKSILDLHQNKDVSTGEGCVIASADGRFAARLKQFTSLHKYWDNPKGVPLSAILFCSRRSSGMPLITESLSWAHGVFMAASLRSETGSGGILQHDPMGMRSTISYNFSHYIQHWLKMEASQRKMPKIFFANWYRRHTESDQLLWPGFGENIRVFDWITRRLSVQEGGSLGLDDTINSPLGKLPIKGVFRVEGLDQLDWQQLMSVPSEFCSNECKSIENFFIQEMGDEIPQEMLDELKAMQQRLNNNVFAVNNNDKSTP